MKVLLALITPFNFEKGTVSPLSRSVRLSGMEGTWNEGKPSQNLNSSAFTNNSGVMLVGI